MNPKIKNAILFAGIGLVLILVYVFLTRGGGEEPPLISSAPNLPASDAASSMAAPAVGGDFLPVLLSIRGIKLDTSLFSDPAFLSLRDSSIVLVPDGTEGRLNPFAPIGSDPVVLTPTPPAAPASSGATTAPTGVPAQ